MMKPTPMLLAVLSTLYEAPMHPYQMHRTMLERGKDLIADVKPGSIYHAVQRLEKYGLAEPVETTKEGNRPERTTYRITGAGRAACIDWVRTMLAHPKSEYPQFLAALASMALLGPQGARDALIERVHGLESELATHRRELEPVVAILPRIVLVETEYLIAIGEAELAWLRRLIADLESGALDWDEASLRRIAEEMSHGRPVS